LAGVGLALRSLLFWRDVRENVANRSDDRVAVELNGIPQPPGVMRLRCLTLPGRTPAAHY
jgi:hypothetical protein